MDELLDLLMEQTLDAANANQKFLAVIVAQLVAKGVLDFHELSSALSAESALIDQLRDQGDDPRLHATTFLGLAGYVEHALGVLGKPMPPFRPLRTDFRDPHWPALSDNDP